MSIFISSYPYVFERHIRIFDFFKKQDDLVFILPRTWKSKGGKLIDRPVQKPYGTLIATPAYFWHSRYPLIRGQLKGWMPATGEILRKHAKPGDVLLTSIEPNMLVTYLNARLARRLGLKHVFITWQNIRFRKLISWLIRQTVRLSAGVMFGTEKARETFLPYLEPHLKTAVIPQSGVDTELFAPMKKPHDGIVFLFGAVFDERKGVMTTIEAFRMVHTQEPTARLVMIGIGKLWDAAQARVRALKLESAVTFISWLPNEKLPDMFASADVFVHPSEPYRDWEEQYGWTMLQASSSGLPVIATRIGSIPEAVLDGTTGILVSPKNPEELSVAMLKLVRDPELRKRMGQAGRAYMLERFSHATVAQHMEDFLRSL